MTVPTHAGTTPPSGTGADLPPARAPAHSDSVLESLGKAIADAVMESSGENDQADSGARRRVAGERARAEAARQEREERALGGKP